MRQIILLAPLVLLVASASANIPDLALSTAQIPDGPVPRYLMVAPDGSGPAMTEATVDGGATVDATITLTLVDGNGDPVYLFPGEDLWLEDMAGELAYCYGGMNADASADENGQTTFSGPFNCGYQNAPGNELQVFVAGSPLIGPSLPVHFNSPDLNGDLVVNLTDIVLFAMMLAGNYDWAGDLNHDQTINLVDIVLMSYAVGAGCP
jgi:hypothetical protein